MKYRALGIQTLRQAPKSARTEGEALLFRAAVFSPDGMLTSLGERLIERLQALFRSFKGDAFFRALELPVLSDAQGDVYAPHSAGKAEALRCPSCGYFSLREQAEIGRQPIAEEALPIERVWTPGCNTIESLAHYLNIPPARTAKALMFTRLTDGEFIFVVVRGDTTLNPQKLAALVGEVRPATVGEILAAGTVPGYASPIGLRRGLVLVDSWIPLSPNLVAGANEEGYHLKNVNYGRDYMAQQVADLIWAEAGDLCTKQDGQLEALAVLPLQRDGVLLGENVLRALAEIHHDAQGLCWPACIAPFDIYLLDVPGKELNTRAIAQKLYERLSSAGLEVLFDDRDERAGVKFTDADLLGIPWRITVGERALKEGHLEVKDRRKGEILRLSFEESIPFFESWKRTILSL